MSDQQYQHSGSHEDPHSPAVELWRDEVHRRVDRYRTRRGRRIEGAFTMRFPFPPSDVVAVDAVVPEQPLASLLEATAPALEIAPEQVAEIMAPETFVAATEEVQTLESVAANPPETEVALAPEPAPQPVLEVAREPEPYPRVPTEVAHEAEPEPYSQPAPPRPRSKRKVIAFPRQPQVPNAYRLADPVLAEQPRILDVPEELEAFPTTPFLEGLQFGPTPRGAEAGDTEHSAMSLRGASIVRRIGTALIDAVTVAAAIVAFAAVVHKMSPQFVPGKPLLPAAALAAALLWAAYQYLFMVYGGGTAGMRVMSLRLRTLKGRIPKRKERRHRVLALYFSVASVAMGLLWALVDVDGLCWHDRMSQTYLAAAD